MTADNTLKKLQKAGNDGLLSYARFQGVLHAATDGKKFEELDTDQRSIVEKKLELFGKVPKETPWYSRFVSVSFSVMICMATLLGSVWGLVLLFKLVGIIQ